MRTNALHKVFDKLNAVQRAQAVIEARLAQDPGGPVEVSVNAAIEPKGPPDMVPPAGRPDVPAAVEFSPHTGLPMVAMERFPDSCRGECEDEPVDDLAIF
jgi:hypothetical protein